MELRHYWQIIVLYWWVVVLLTLAGLASAYQYYSSNRPLYTNTLTVNVSREPSPNDQYSEYYANISSEYAADDFTVVLGGNVFLDDVAALLQTRGINLTSDDLKGIVEIERKHREVYVTAKYADKSWSLAVNQAVADTLKANAGKYIKANATTQPIRANVVDIPKDAPLSGGRTLLLAVIRPVLGLVIGLVLAFLLAYLDNSLRTEADVKAFLGLPVLATIPPAGRRGSSQPLSPVAAPPDTSAREKEAEREKVARG